MPRNPSVRTFSHVIRGPHGYQVAFARQGKRLRLFFGDSAHGNRGRAYRRALKAAQAIESFLRNEKQPT
jgi:hypothetical protein